MVSRGVLDGSILSDRARIAALRDEAAALLHTLDEHELFEAAALMASAVDAINASLVRLDGAGLQPRD